MSIASQLSFLANTAGVLTVPSSASSTSTNSGALQVVGGIGVGGGAYFGGVITATNFILNGYQVSTGTSGVSSANSATSVSIQSTLTNASFYPVFVSQNTSTITALPEYTTSTFSINPSTGVVTLNSTVATTSTTTGALIVTGGVGVSDSMYVGNRVGWGSSTGTSVAYQFYNQATSSMDMVFG
jgi:hypothetical protein